MTAGKSDWVPGRAKLSRLVVLPFRLNEMEKLKVKQMPCMVTRILWI